MVKEQLIKTSKCGNVEQKLNIYHVAHTWREGDEKLGLRGGWNAVEQIRPSAINNQISLLFHCERNFAVVIPFSHFFSSKILHHYSKWIVSPGWIIRKIISHWKRYIYILFIVFISALMWFQWFIENYITNMITI